MSNIMTTSRVVKLLAARFSFDESEATTFLDETTEMLASMQQARLPTFRAKLLDEDLSATTDAASERAMSWAHGPLCCCSACCTIGQRKGPLMLRTASRRQKGPNRRDRSGYLMFCKSQRERVANELASCDKFHPRDITDALAAEWRELPYNGKEWWKSQGEKHDEYNSVRV
jgi:hypothetical protein